MITAFASSGAAANRASLLPALLAVVLAIVFWMVAEDARQQLPEIDLQIDAAARTARRADDGTEASRLRASRELAEQQRAELQARLQTTEDIQMIRAKLVFDLRQKCAATGASGCNIRLADDTFAAATIGQPAAAAPRAAGAAVGADEATKLSDLGVQKARAIVSGTFQDNEIVDFSRALHRDRNAYWRINGLVVRGTTFEFDVERHVITTPRGGS